MLTGKPSGSKKPFTFELTLSKTHVSIGAIKKPVRHSGWNVKSPDSQSGLSDNFSGGSGLSETPFRIISVTKVHSL